MSRDGIEPSSRGLPESTPIYLSRGDILETGVLAAPCSASTAPIVNATGETISRRR